MARDAARTARARPGRWPLLVAPAERWTHAGVDCAVAAGPYAWNGYARLPRGHPWRRRNYDEIPAQVHGGLTFGHHAAMPPVAGFRGRPEVTAEDTDGWIGFDTMHAFDAWPELELGTLALAPGVAQVRRTLDSLGEHWPDWTIRWTYAALRAEVQSLAEQIAAARPVNRARRQRLAGILRARERRRRRRRRRHRRGQPRSGPAPPATGAPAAH